MYLFTMIGEIEIILGMFSTNSTWLQNTIHVSNIERNGSITSVDNHKPTIVTDFYQTYLDK